MQFNSHSSKIFGLCVLTAMLASFSTASAQEGAQPAEESSAQETGASSSAQEGQETGAISPEDPLFWAKTRDIFTVQKRPFQKDGRFAASIYGGIIPNNIFERYYPVGLRLNYFVLENIGLELAASYAFTAQTSLSDTVEGLSQDAGVLLGDRPTLHSNFGLMWSPFYGKTSFYSSALAYFDMYLFGGAGVVITETQSDFGADLSSTTKPEGVLGAGLAFYLGDHVTVRLDYRQFIYEKVTGGVANPSEASLGLGWFF